MARNTENGGRRNIMENGVRRSIIENGVGCNQRENGRTGTENVAMRGNQSLTVSGCHVWAASLHHPVSVGAPAGGMRRSVGRLTCNQGCKADCRAPFLYQGL